MGVPGVVLTLIAFFAYCSGEATCFLWTPSYFAGTKTGLSAETIASFGSLVFGGLMLGRLISGFISNKQRSLQNPKILFLQQAFRLAFLVELVIVVGTQVMENLPI